MHACIEEGKRKVDAFQTIQTIYLSDDDDDDDDDNELHCLTCLLYLDLYLMVLVT